MLMIFLILTLNYVYNMFKIIESVVMVDISEMQDFFSRNLLIFNSFLSCLFWKF